MGVLYYSQSENKDADQLHGYREADLRLCFRICKKPVFSRRGSYLIVIEGYYCQFSITLCGGSLESNQLW